MSMITITPAAAVQISKSAEQNAISGLPLRIVVEQKDDGRFHYLMGFDDQSHPGDLVLESAGIVLVTTHDSKPLINGLTLDFVDLDGALEFVFMNPNDPNYKPPQE